MVHQKTGVDLSAMPDQVLDVGRWRRLLYGFERDDDKGLQATERKGLSRTPLAPAFLRERWAKYFAPRTPKLKEPAPGSDVVQQLHEIQDAMPEEKALYAHTSGDAEKAAMAASAVCKQVFSKMAPKKSNRNTRKLRRQVEGLKGMAEQHKDLGNDVPKSLQNRIKKAEEALEVALDEAAKMAKGLDDVSIRQAIREGCEQAQKELDELDDVRQGFSFGSQPGVPVRLNTEEAKKLSRRIQNQDKLKQIALLGRKLRAEAAEKQKQKSELLRTEVSSVETGQDVDRFLPREIVDMTSPIQELRLTWGIRFAESKCLQYKLQGKEAKQKGPILFCADESGSQSGQPEIETKATALAFLEIARRQKRGWGYIHFDATVTRVDSFPLDGQVDQETLIACMEWFTSGGTNFSVALDKAVQMIESEGFEDADVLMITDGICSTDPGWDERFRSAKKRLKFNVYTVLTGHWATRPTVEKWSDKVFLFNELLSDEFKDKMYAI